MYDNKAMDVAKNDLNKGLAAAKQLDKYVKQVMAGKISKRLFGDRPGTQGNLKPKTLEG